MRTKVVTEAAIGHVKYPLRGWSRLAPWAGAVLLLVVAGASSVRAEVAGAVTIDNVGQRIEEAKTKADEEALVAFFKAEAAAQTEGAKKHQAMLKSYAATPGKAGERLREHCQTLIKLYQDQAKVYGEMAAYHEKLAGEMGAGKR